MSTPTIVMIFIALLPGLIAIPAQNAGWISTRGFRNTMLFSLAAALIVFVIAIPIGASTTPPLFLIAQVAVVVVLAGTLFLYRRTPDDADAAKERRRASVVMTIISVAVVIAVLSTLTQIVLLTVAD